MQNCKGFLHPAVFEGFGIPPLEALSLGAPIALARASCLPELYGDTARYFDPYDYDVDLDALFAKPAAPPDKVLAKYSWEKTARFWLDETKSARKRKSSWDSPRKIEAHNGSAGWGCRTLQDRKIPLTQGDMRCAYAVHRCYVHQAV